MIHSKAVMYLSNDYWKGRGIFKEFGLEGLPERYTWPFSSRTKKYLKDGEIYELTIKLKKELCSQWKKAVEEKNQKKREEITKYIVKDWGGIKRFKKTEKYAEYAKNDADKNLDELSISLTGIASYSKVLSIANPSRFAIFDARVAVSIVAIQLLSETDKGIHLGFLNGRNKIVGYNKEKWGFSQKDDFKKEHVRFDNWEKPKPIDVYKMYLEILRKDAAELSKDMSELEMALFTDAEELAILCFKEFKIELTDEERRYIEEIHS